jgi:hypothetical protein
MKLLAATIAGAALLLGACESDPGPSSGGYYGAYGGYESCRQFASCGTCTPVEGCGWCFDSDGNGMCASSPDECTTPAFSWTWNESGCRVAADAGTVGPGTLEPGTVGPGKTGDAALDLEGDVAAGDAGSGGPPDNHAVGADDDASVNASVEASAGDDAGDSLANHFR